ncbi:bifunctional metallophosphatase/5'-nucleotidase [Paenibacillus faecis]|uniref:Bifunctional metallophosphatase/5'-nucleotidase n=1 Tax=Paenibacillus faecis TaxID=862114 RepID=A0A5D0CYE8_9BACL|nr:bifunctional UDP-sugar hydrolase/5'-nucleotidase [Paenibacillus faecis]TYA14976.1 bifunctional metallophosphatase/5'-nucleotidase [Paenibacillus faecis]
MLPETDQETLTVIYTNDLHSHFGAMGRIAGMIDEQRGIPDTSLLLLDIGDHMDRAAPETEGTLGQANVDILNLTGYDAITVGNNEGLTFTPDLLAQAYAGLLCPVVCGNLRDLATGELPKWAKEHLVLRRGGFTIGLVGATASYPDFYKLLGVEALDPRITIAASVKRLRPQVDLVIVMSHLGLPMDKELAESISGIDLIIGGHTHHLLEEPLWVGNTAITAAGKFGQYLGRIVFRKSSAPAGRPMMVEGHCLPVREGAANERIEKAISIHKLGAKRRLDRTVAVNDRPLPIGYTEESPFGNLLAQAVRRYTGADLAIVNSGQLLMDLPAGEISEGMLHERCPSPINPCRMRLKGKDILYSLEQSLLDETANKAVYGYGFRGKVLGGICVDGMEIRYEADAEPFHKIIEARVQGVPVEPDKDYLVGTLDMFTFGIGYERLKNGTGTEYMLPDFLRDLLRMELQTTGAVETCFLPRWKKSAN